MGEEKKFHIYWCKFTHSGQKWKRDEIDLNHSTQTSGERSYTTYGGKLMSRGMVLSIASSTQIAHSQG